MKNTQEISILRWGNSLVIHIPSSIVKRLTLRPGVVLEISVQDNHILLRPKNITLSDLLDQITQDNQQGIEFSENDVALF